VRICQTLHGPHVINISPPCARLPSSSTKVRGSSSHGQTVGCGATSPPLLRSSASAPCSPTVPDPAPSPRDDGILAQYRRTLDDGELSNPPLTASYSDEQSSHREEEHWSVTSDELDDDQNNNLPDGDNFNQSPFRPDICADYTVEVPCAKLDCTCGAMRMTRASSGETHCAEDRHYFPCPCCGDYFYVVPNVCRCTTCVRTLAKKGRLETTV
jgi:hypothetical protein